MQEQTLAAEILAAAKPTRKIAGWFDRLDDEQRSVVLEIRTGWLASRKVTGVSAMQMARTMIGRLSDRGYGFPCVKELASWLTKQE